MYCQGGIVGLGGFGISTFGGLGGPCTAELVPSLVFNAIDTPVTKIKTMKLNKRVSIR
jgi:hypothetical protein